LLVCNLVCLLVRWFTDLLIGSLSGLLVGLLLVR
jgi:hypothetical protein